MVTLTVLIPTLNAAEGLPGCLDALIAARPPYPYGAPPLGEVELIEVLVADGGSSDATRAIAEASGARVLDCEPGRGLQLSQGMAEAKGDWVLVLHADTRLGPGWEDAVAGFLPAHPEGRRAACFMLAFDEDSAPARRVAALANWRSRALGLPYGDQGLLLHRTDYVLSGGYPRDPLMEDVTLARRLRRTLGRQWLEMLPAPAVTSAARYRAQGWWRRPLRNLSILALYFLGVSPRRLAKLYG